MYRLVVFVHILTAFAFMLSHGASAAIAFQLKRERELERIRSLLDVSGTTWLGFSIGFLGLLVAGIALGFMGRWWGKAGSGLRSGSL